MFYDNYVTLCRLKGVSPSTAAKKMGMAGGHVYKWKNGAQPNPATVLKIAEYFGVSTDRLYGNETVSNEFDIDSFMNTLSREQITEIAIKAIDILSNGK